jgi:hypothetical protein
MYEWIQGELGKLGIAISGTCLANILRRNSVPPQAIAAPDLCQNKTLSVSRVPDCV